MTSSSKHRTNRRTERAETRKTDFPKEKVKKCRLT